MSISCSGCSIPRSCGSNEAVKLVVVLPFLAGIIVDGAGFFAAFCCVAVAAVTVVVMLRK